MAETTISSQERRDLTTTFFANYYEQDIPYSAAEVDSVIGYFLKRGFDQVSAVNTSVILLRQANRDKLNVHQLIDTLKGITDVQLSNIVAQILNLNRSKTSTLGYRIPQITHLFDQRNIIV